MKRTFTKYIISFLLAQSFVLICTAQSDIPSPSSGNLQFYVDDASFFSQEKIYQEVYLMIYTNQLKITSKNNSDYALLSINLKITNNAGELVVKENWETEAEVVYDTNSVDEMVVYDQWASHLEPGIYNIEIEIADKIGGKTGTARRELRSTLQDQGDFFLSDIQFAGEVTTGADSDDIFSKGDLRVIPNPSRRYGVLNPVLYFYYEIYSPDISNKKEVKIDYEIQTSLGTSLRSFEGKTVTLTGASSGVPNGLNVSAVASGIYKLIISATDLQTQVKVTSSRMFEVIQLDYISKGTFLTEDQAEMFGEIIRLISIERDYDLYSSLSLSAKAKFLIRFWQQNDPYPATDENEFFNKITERYQFANKQFSWGGIEGWKTDRGRILIKNGMPDNIIRYESEESTLPYVIWEYQQQRNYIYVFGDLRSDGRYTLLHSNKEGEIYNPYWKEELNQM